jgi:activator of HSP90 ATPase
MPVKVIKQKVVVAASPHEVFEMILDEKKHAELTGDVAHIERTVGGTFSVFDGYATGTNLEIVKDKKLVQEWRASDWPPTASSVATFTFKPHKQGCELHFTQTGVPGRFVSDIARGWIEYYWKPLKAHFGKE